MPSQTSGIKMIKQLIKGSKTDSIASQFGLHQLINEPAQLTRNISSRIDVIFTHSQSSNGIWSTFFTM